MLKCRGVFVNNIKFVQINKLLTSKQNFNMLIKQFFILYNGLSFHFMQLNLSPYFIFTLYNYIICINKKDYKNLPFYKKGLIKPFYLYNLKTKSLLHLLNLSYLIHFNTT